MKYDFETMCESEVASKDMPFPKAYEGTDLVPNMGLISVYVPINQEA